VSWSFPVVAAKSGAYAFGFFALMMVLQFVLVLKFLPETKGYRSKNSRSAWRGGLISR